jgi:DNA-directed RNA polymerase subunit H (RpoH/RPB5)
MDILFEKYENIQKCILTYRNYISNEKFLDLQTFKKTMQMEQYIHHKYIDPKRGRNIYIYIFMDNSKYIKTTPLFKRLVDKIPDESVDVIIITKIELSIYIKKALLKYTNLKVFNYLHKYFSIELSKGPLCSKHTVMTNNEVKDLCSRELIIHPLSLPSISINDPQNIWVGGELGEVIKIESISEITGRTIRYRIVSPDSGKMTNIQKLKESIQENEDVQLLENEINNPSFKKKSNSSIERKDGVNNDKDDKDDDKDDDDKDDDDDDDEDDHDHDE